MYNYKNFRKLDDASTNIDLCIYELYSSNYVIHSADEYIIDGIYNGECDGNFINEDC